MTALATENIIDVTQLDGDALNWAVAKATGIDFNFDCDDINSLTYIVEDEDYVQTQHTWNPIGDWAQGGPIIESEGITLLNANNCGWAAAIGELWSEDDHQLSATPLIAAMRCYVESKLGSKVAIPE